MDITNTIKQRLCTEIKTSGLSTIEIAKRVGVSPEMITQYCTTKKLPKLDTFARLCNALDLDANYILCITD
jgi:transcriptional regulator with XRE-family HTH domain